MKKIAIILAGGSGKRLGLSKPKQFLKIGGKTILESTISIFQNHSLVDDIVVVVHKNYKNELEEIVKKNNFTKVIKILDGGMERFDSTLTALNYISIKNAYVIIHDAVRPFLSDGIITDCIKTLEKKDYKALDVVVNCTDTIVISHNEKDIKEIPNRNYYYQGQTPQCFEINTIKEAYKLALKNNDRDFTDDCSLILRYNIAKVGIIKGDYSNIKITHENDLNIANSILRFQSIKDDIEYNTDLYKTSFTNKNFIVFGGSKGIGKDIVKIIKQYTNNIFIVSRSNGYDVENIDNIKKAFIDAYIFFGKNKIDFLVSTIGLLKISSLFEKTDVDVLKEINTNYVSNVFIVKYALKYLNNNASIALFSSSSAFYGRKNYSIYSSSKSAIINFVQAISDELRTNSNIKINVIVPSRTNTEMRQQNFIDNKNDLLDPYFIANETLKILTSTKTGLSLIINKK